MLAALVGIPIVLNYIGLASAIHLLVEIARWPLLFMGMSLAIACIYSYGPSRETTHWRGITRGSAFAAVAWIGASLLFSWYVTNFNSYDWTYGSLAAVIGFMTWIWISVIIILFGAELDVELECSRNDHDTISSSRN
jgi:membrane protein